MTPTDTLKEEHQVILIVLGAAEREARAIQMEGRLDADRVEEMVDFFRNFADRSHHGKEEKLLFARMHQRGLALEHGPLAVMLQEHDEGRRRVTAVAEALPAARNGDPAAVATVKDHLWEFCQLLRAHIAKEDGVLFPLADRLLTPRDQEELAEAFDRFDAEEISQGVQGKYRQLADRLAG